MLSCTLDLENAIYRPSPLMTRNHDMRLQRLNRIQRPQPFPPFTRRISLPKKTDEHPHTQYPQPRRDEYQEYTTQSNQAYPYVRPQ